MRLKTLSVSSYEKRTNHELQNRTTLLAINTGNHRLGTSDPVPLPKSLSGLRGRSIFCRGCLRVNQVKVSPAEQNESVTIGGQCLRAGVGTLRQQIVLPGCREQPSKGELFSRGHFDEVIVDKCRIDGNNGPLTLRKGKSSGRIEVSQAIAPPGGRHRKILECYGGAFLDSGVGSGIRNTTDKGLAPHEETHPPPHGKHAQSTIETFWSAYRQAWAGLPLWLCSGNKIVAT